LEKRSYPWPRELITGRNRALVAIENIASGTQEIYLCFLKEGI